MRGGWTLAMAAGLVLGAGTGPVGADDSCKMTVPLLRVGTDPDVIAVADFRSSGSRSSFRVRFRHAAPGAPITLRVGGVPRATRTANSHGNGRFGFRTGSRGSSLPLDFDPRGATIELGDDSQTLLDNVTSSGGNPPGSIVDERVALTPTGAIPGASGRVRLRERDGERDFDVEIEDVPAGAYDLLIDGHPVGTIVVAGGQGEIEFSNDTDDADELPLDFEPVGALVEVAQGGTVILSGRPLAGGSGGTPPGGTCTPGESITLLANVGPDPDAHGDARFRVRDDCRLDFRVEIEDLPVGDYELLVGGTVRGTITVVDLGAGQTEGEIEFDTGDDDLDELPLDFDPTGQTIDIRQNGTIFLSSTVTPPGGGTCQRTEVEPAMTNVGPVPGASGKARFRQDDDCDTDLRVEVQNLPAGSYEFFVGSTQRGTIVVASGQGEIEFDTEADDPDELPLDFEVAGQRLEVRQGPTVFLRVDIPG